MSRKGPNPAGYHPFWVALPTAVAFWPVWRWYGLRTVDGSDEPWGILALALAACLWATRFDRHARVSPRRVVMLGFIVLMYLGLRSYVPTLVVAILAISSVWIIAVAGCRETRSNLALWGLLLLSLPLLATLQFYGGYPMRWLTAHSASSLLSLLGCAVQCEGLSLLYHGERVLIDAPCSGVRMMWAGAFHASALGCVLRLKNPNVLLLWAAAFCAVLLGNSLRAAWVFLHETQLIVQPQWMHKGAGILIFGVLGWALLCLAQRLERTSVCAA